MNSASMLKISAKVFASVLAVASVATASYAQSSRTPIKVDVPFAFETGNGALPAGEYTIRMASNTVTAIQGNHRGGVTISMVEQNTPATSSRVVFHKYGNRYLLSDVWIEGQTSHLHFVPTKAEKREQVELAANGAALENVELALVEMPR